MDDAPRQQNELKRVVICVGLVAVAIGVVVALGGGAPPSPTTRCRRRSSRTSRTRARTPSWWSTACRSTPATGTGAARALLDAAVADAARRGRGHVSLEVDADSPTGADRLYEALGFRTARDALAMRDARVFANRQLPHKTTAAVDPVTGRVTTGFSGERLDPPPGLRERLPSESLHIWVVENCGEVAACTRQLDGVTDIVEQRAILDRLEMITVFTRGGMIAAPCNNCQRWVR
ncbi:hypothetical protein GC089_12605 [Cellulomonas sp. JZ18]|uniref:GNAT family N-acetyltransferase n=1 Tax=Cellulomonas sp. JZ18 TaxID=2654191 RepID=UPI0012D40595|nr:hypothetical protein GC089_12605 [Cellulomonas sp. JZ18]